MRSKGRALCRLVVGVVACLVLFVGQKTGASAHSMPRAGTAPSNQSGCQQAPRDADLRTLTDQQLLDYGLPTHAALDGDLDSWSHVVRTMTRFCSSQPPQRYPAHHLQGSAVTHSCTGQTGQMCPNSIWAGNEAVSGRGTYTRANVYFQVPNVSQAVVGAIASSWVGVGGDGRVTNPVVLVQTGADATAQSGGAQSNYSWIEVEPNMGYSQGLPLCRLWTGDQMRAYLLSNFMGGGCDYFYLENQSAGCYATCNIHTNNNTVSDTCGVSGGASYNSDSATGDCIVERVGGQPVAKWNVPSLALSQTGCSFDPAPNSLNLTGIGSLPHFWNTIVNSSNQTLVDVGPIYNGDSQDLNWHQAT